MIEIHEKQKIIIESYVNGKSQREIARTIGVDRKTVIILLLNNLGRNMKILILMFITEVIINNKLMFDEDKI